MAEKRKPKRHVSSEPGGEYQVGYKQPPREHRFEKGKSGNPQGRPKGSRNLSTLLRAELNKRVTVTVRGRTTQILKGEAVVTQLVNEAAKGNASARRDLLPLMQGLELADSESGAHQDLAAEDRQIQALMVKRILKYGSEDAG